MASLAEILRFGSKFNIFCREKNKIILFAYLIIAFGLCQKTQSSAKCQKYPKSINVFVKCQNLEQHVVRNNINLRVVRNSTFSVEKKKYSLDKGPFNKYVDKMRGEGQGVHSI